MKIVPMQTPRAVAAPAAGQTAKTHIAALDGLRFIAALMVAAAHYAAWTLERGYATDLLFSLSGLGMTLFFVLSGVVIHYNYGALLKEPGGLKKFAVARFSRLYPLYLLLFVVEFIVYFGWESGSCGLAGDFSSLFLPCRII